MYGNRVIDAIVASRFVPSSQVTGIHDKLNLTTEGTNLLYASAPAVEAGQVFNSACESTERTQAILGCYSMRRIYLYDISNPELAGAEETTAAHEMLHAAYERLNIFERPVVDNMLVSQYEKLKSDPKLSKLVSYYEQAEPDAIENELHSILGTTQVGLTPELEKYYARYFNDRQAIVAMNQKYSDVFAAVDERAKQLSDEINSLKPRVEAELGQYHTDLQKLNEDVASFNSQVKDGVYKTQSAFNVARQALLARVNALNARRDAINKEVAAYNALVAEQNKLSVRVDELNSSINAAPIAGGV